DAIVGQHCFGVVHGLLEPTPGCPTLRCRELRQPCDLVIQEPHLGNRWFNVRCEPMLAPDGHLSGIVHTMQDITARKQAEDDLRKAHNELEERVRERTAELTNVNEVLHAEIVEHERADRSIRMSHRLLEIANLHTEIAPLLKDFAAEIRGFTGYAGVGVCVVDAGGNPLYEAYDGFTREFFEVESAACVRSKRCKCVSVVEGTVDKSSALYTEGGSFCINSIARFMREASGQESGQAFEVCRRHGYESMALVPVLISDHARGFIQVADPRENALPGDLVQTLEKAGLQLGIAIRRVMAESSAATDHLTGLFNHRHFVDRLEQEVASAHRQCGAFSLAMIDIDGFKKVNDMLGHMAGDRVLREVAGTIRGCIRGYDVAFRYGGDEFAIILPDAGYDGAATTVDRIRKAIGEVTPAGIGVPEVKLGLSGGVACFPNDSTNSQELIMMADTALYRAKQRGGNGTCRAAEPEASPVPDRNWETFRMNSVYALAAAVDAKDHHTFGHSGRVAALCTSLGYRLGMSTPLVERLSSAALLHDIGKLSVPDKVLRKREDLTEQEWEEVRRHPEHGIRIIEKIPQLTPIVPAILHHHERFDGLGYPSGLKGEDIPLKARVIAIVDAYDTMTSARSYRGVLSTEEALAELRRCAGTQFDPELVEAFAAMIIEGQVKGLSVSPER
ncbi:MAG: diguanylate cyclase, partial [Chloroflexi bacterium]|nr:diguanylate cyclase [Chloroflexota bacterium]